MLPTLRVGHYTAKAVASNPARGRVRHSRRHECVARGTIPCHAARFPEVFSPATPLLGDAARAAERAADPANDTRGESVEHDVTAERARPVSTRFELAALRMVGAWLAAGRMSVSAAEMQIAREFLEHAGWSVEDAPGARVRLVNAQGRAEEMSRESAVLAALQRLANRK